MKRTKSFLLFIMVLLLGLAVSGAAFAGSLENATDETEAVVTYRELADKEDWDAVIDKAWRRWKETQGASSLIDVSVTPEAFQMLYELGPEAAPYLLEVASEHGNTAYACLLGHAAYANMHVTKEAYTKVSDRAWCAGSGSELVEDWNLLVAQAPTLVEQICEADKPVDQKLIELNELGLLALPALTVRLQDGETQWQPYFEAQMLSLTAEERFAALVDESVYNYKENNGALVYAHRLTVARPVDVFAWKTENADAFTVLTESVG